MEKKPTKIIEEKTAYTVPPNPGTLPEQEIKKEEVMPLKKEIIVVLEYINMQLKLLGLKQLTEIGRAHV